MISCSFQQRLSCLSQRTEGLLLLPFVLRYNRSCWTLCLTHLLRYIWSCREQTTLVLAVAREPRLSNKPPVSKTASYSPPRWNPEAAQLFQPLQISGHVPSSMRLTCASFWKQQHCGPTQHKVPTEDPLTLSITTIQPTVGLYTMEIQLWPNFFHLLWSFQLFWDTHLHATVQLISCFTGCILQFFSDGSPSDILWQLISKVGHEFKKYVIWAPLTINYFLALFFFFLRDCLESKYERVRKSWWIGNLSKQHAVNLMLWINKTPWRGNKGVYVLTAMPCFTEL